ncbi:MAG: hypothetical protein IJM78_07280 [Prevotella sp.]|nr:hypothetical protein [Prevotella sp.]
MGILVAIILGAVIFWVAEGSAKNDRLIWEQNKREKERKQKEEQERLQKQEDVPQGID